MQPESQSEWVVVFRSAEHSAAEESAAVQDLLGQAGIAAEVIGDDQPGVPVGSCEVRVPASDAARAEQLIASESSETDFSGDASHDLDLVTVFTSDKHTSEVEAMAVQGMLQANGIQSVLVGGVEFPSLPIEVRVPSTEREEALRLIAESEAAGPEGAEEAEESSEGL